MDSEGSELDDLADIDLATFATPDRDASFQSKEVGFDGGRSSGTDGDSLGDSMDSRASSDMMRPYQLSDTLIDNMDEINSNNSPRERETVSHSYEFSSSNPFSQENLQNSKEQTGGIISIDTHEFLTASDTKDRADFNQALPAPGRPGYIQHYVSLRRLPGENLGMVLAIEGDQDNRCPVEAVLVRSITPGGAAARAGEIGGNIQVGDEVREVDGYLLTELTHDQCIDFFQSMPDHVMLTVHRAAPQDQSRSEADFKDSLNPGQLSSKAPVPVPRPRGCVSHLKASDLDDKMTGSMNSTPRQEDDDGFIRTPRGFVKLDLTVFRGEGDSLGLSIIPSHGATCDLYQVSFFFFFVHSSVSYTFCDNVVLLNLFGNLTFSTYAAQ